MGKQAINLGTPPTGIGGDTPRSANIKINSNFDELYAADLVNYKRSNVLGTVSQASGVPTGAVIERGTNANGSYVKLVDGAMICTRIVNFALTPNISWGAAFITSGVPVQAYAGTFTTAPVIDMLLTVSNGYAGTGWLIGVAEPSNISWPGCFIADLASRGITSFNIHYIAVGRWF
ncbi:hypothetical protein KRR23_05605 [Pseudomonas sp. CVAP|uniref:hypothetical protein n=1 Tax=Pseudomonas sp. CVAP\|nr:hypothetical protein [Pseudomonas sp. CVAP\